MCVHVRLEDDSPKKHCGVEFEMDPSLSAYSHLKKTEHSLSVVWFKNVFRVYMSSLKTPHDLTKKKKKTNSPKEHCGAGFEMDRSLSHET